MADSSSCAPKLKRFNNVRTFFGTDETRRLSALTLGPLSLVDSNKIIIGNSSETFKALIDVINEGFIDDLFGILRNPPVLQGLARLPLRWSLECVA
ncbi:unnamed protein product [Brassica rapa]|uniref:Uncharacterized protein n=1 Tax=Brassica campestris TaxID=3711 RepID=A0A3P6CJV6_BRACM|nr:unnamed protein product [Brassica rapa]VDD19017.1 unnamed protein product [Brassica rapa]